MTDMVSPERRSRIMARIGPKDTKPEMTVRRLVHAMGYRYRLHRRDLPGTPDLVFPSRGKVIFVHGCFWHRHQYCGRASLPKSNRDFWLRKLEGNAERDSQNQQRLAELGWDALVLWECEVQERVALKERVVRFLEEPRG